MDNRTHRFVEVQRFRQWWFWLLLVGAAALVVGICAYGLYVQLVLRRPFGNNPTSDTALLATSIAAFVVWVAVLALFAVMHLRTEVRADGLYIRFFPLHRSFHRLPLGDVTEIEAVTYRPVMQYGGYGIRYSFGSPGGTKGKAYNVSGNRGVRLTFTTNRHLLIGSQKPDELAAAIESLRESGAGR
jgi:hypothetical protein